MLVLGLDLGSLATGFALIEGKKKVVASGTLKARRKDHFDRRCYDLAIDIIAIMTEHPGINSVYIEDIFYGANHQTLAKLAQVRGAVSAAVIGQLNIIPTYLTATQVKKAVSLSGSSSKVNVHQCVKFITGVDAKSKDESDAIAVALAGIALEPLHVISQR